MLVSLLIIVAVLLAMWQDGQRSVGTLWGIAALGILPYGLAAWIAWASRRKTARSVLWFILNLVVAVPMVLLTMAIRPGVGDELWVFGVLLLSTIQWIAVGVISRDHYYWYEND